MHNIRHAAVAGRFYPAAPAELRSMISDFLASAKKAAGPPPKAVIAPHAGYPFSGPIAASAFAAWAPLRGKIKRVVLAGTGHWGPPRGLGVSSADAFETPLGCIELDRPAIEMLRKFPQVAICDEAHEREHSLEVQLPFLQEVLGDFSLVPLTVGEASPGEVAEVLLALWDGPETVIVLSSDLSHYHDYETARRLDEATARAIESLEPIVEGQACGCCAINGLLRAAGAANLRATALDLRSSGGTAGPRDEVVGYGAFAFQERNRDRMELSGEERKSLLRHAHEALRHGLEHGCAPKLDLSLLSPALVLKGAAFVTLSVNGELRGCIGSIRAFRPLAQDVAENACAAAFEDLRFPSLERQDLERVVIHVSVLSELEPVYCSSEHELLGKMRPGIDGLVLEDQGCRGTLLPSMWEQLPTSAEFLQCLKRKARLRPDHWSLTLKVWRFTTDVVS